MRNPFARQPAPTAATLHAQQQIATLSAELRQARATIDTLQRDNATLRNERDEARCNYEFYYDEYRRTCAAGGKHQ